MHIFIYLFISILAVTGAAGQDIPDKVLFRDFTYQSGIKTVELYRSGWRLSPPFRNLRDTASLILEFDDLSNETPRYTYTLIHCTADWKPSSIVSTEYLSGLTDNEIRDYRYSRNALQPYTHYRLELPNDDVRPTLPGNYLLYVFREYDRNQPVLTRRFWLADPLVNINPDIHRTDNINLIYSDQEVDFTVLYDRLEPDDPSRNFRVTVCQNLNRATENTALAPKFIQPGELIYNYEEENLFPGGSEFRHFDTKSLKFNSDRIREIRFQRPLKHVYLLDDKPLGRSAYHFQEDLNGKYLVKWDDAFDSDTEADYVWVHFRLNTTDSIAGSDLYVFGSLTNWDTLPEAKCTFSSTTGCYEADMLLKQGYYNYAYAVSDRKTGKINLTEIDGSHYETENDYFIFVYYRDIRERFDRLVGIQAANSIKQSKN